MLELTFREALRIGHNYIRTGGNGAWTWHSLRHVFCMTRLPTPRPSCGGSVGILARLGAAIVIRDTLFLPYAQVRGLTR